MRPDEGWRITVTAPKKLNGVRMWFHESHRSHNSAVLFLKDDFFDL